MRRRGGSPGFVGFHWRILGARVNADISRRPGLGRDHTRRGRRGSRLPSRQTRRKPRWGGMRGTARCIVKRARRGIDGTGNDGRSHERSLLGIVLVASAVAEVLGWGMGANETMYTPKKSNQTAHREKAGLPSQWVPDPTSMFGVMNQVACGVCPNSSQTATTTPSAFLSSGGLPLHV